MLHRNRTNPLSTVVLGSLAACGGSAHAAGSPPPAEFEVATIVVERNATDGDTEIVINVTAGDEGLRWLRMRTPDLREIAMVASYDRTSQGLREFKFESPEPEGESILASYPPGKYRFIGRSTSGERFFSTARLSHSMPHAPVIINPVQDETVSTDALTIQWSAVPGAVQYVVEFENESAEPEQALVVNVPGSETSFDVPPALLLPGSEYQVGIAAVGGNGNITVTETTFSTAD